MTDVIARKRYLMCISNYLETLSELTGLSLERDDLESLDFTAKLIDELRVYKQEQPSVIVIKNPSSSAANLIKVIQDIEKLNDKSVYVFIENTAFCGALEISSIRVVDFNNILSLLPSGMISFLTTDLKDYMLLDFDCEEFTIELRGACWPRCQMNIVGKT